MTAGLPANEDAAALTVIWQLSGDTRLVTVGGDGGEVCAVTLAATEHEGDRDCELDTPTKHW